jgi:hypothetical protein
MREIACMREKRRAGEGRRGREGEGGKEREGRRGRGGQGLTSQVTLYSSRRPRR